MNGAVAKSLFVIIYKKHAIIAALRLHIHEKLLDGASAAFFESSYLQLNDDVHF